MTNQSHSPSGNDPDSALADLPYGFWETPEPPATPRVPALIEEFTEGSDLLELIGKNTNLPIPSTRMPSDQQIVNICLLSSALFNTGSPITCDAIWSLWESKSDLPETLGAFTPGGRPSQNQILDYMSTLDYEIRMKELGIELDPANTGLSAKQIGLVQLLVAPNGKSMKQRLRDAEVPYSLFNTWMRSEVFNAYYSKIANQVLHDAIPTSLARLAENAADGDLNSTKYFMELTGRHDPNARKVVDAQNLVRVILGVLEEEVTDVETLQRIGAKINTRAVGLTIQGEIT